MATLSLAAFLAKWTDNITGRFADNTSQAIGADDLREFADDIADSFTLSGGLNFALVQIGDWNMDTTSIVSVSHGITDYKKIRSITAIIRDDSDTYYYSIPSAAAVDVYFLEQGSGGGSDGTITSTIVRLGRRTGGYFDSTSFNATSFNRGWIVIGYVK